jgi:deazaflavin-dependent oxidoreductase (nitroreductase family)
VTQPGFDVRIINRRIIEAFRANGGRLSGPLDGVPMLLLTTTGARTGEQRTSPLAYGKVGDAVFVLALNAGPPRMPDWYRNLRAKPEVTIEVGAEQYQARAIVADRAETAGLLEKWADQNPGMRGRLEARLTQSKRVPAVILRRF